MGNYLNLTWEYFRHFREIGSLVPDSRFCCRTLLQAVPFDSARVIYEYGAGSGRVTREILRRRRPDSILVAFEKNRNLYRKLERNLREDNFYLINSDLLAGTPVLPQGVSGPADCIVSTLPCSSLDFDRLIRRAVLPGLVPGSGVFVQYTHTISVFKGFQARAVLSRYFREVRSSLSLINLPPAVIYTCR